MTSCWRKQAGTRKATRGRLEDKDSKYKFHPPTKKRRNGNKDRDTKKNNKGEKENDTDTKKIKSVMFVPYTRHSELAARLRDSEGNTQDSREGWDKTCRHPPQG